MTGLTKLPECPYDWCEACDMEDEPLHASADIVLMPGDDDSSYPLLRMRFYSDGEFALSADFDSEGTPDEMLLIAAELDQAAERIRETVAKFQGVAL